jgi:hypothetical protein
MHIERAYLSTVLYRLTFLPLLVSVLVSSVPASLLNPSFSWSSLMSLFSGSSFHSTVRFRIGFACSMRFDP